MKTKVFTCKAINSELQAAEYVSKESSPGSAVNRASQRRRRVGHCFHLNVISVSALRPNKQMGFLGFLLSL